MNLYYTVAESEQFTFYRVPKMLIVNARYKTVSAEAKLLYGLMLDRMGLSAKNGWADKEGRTYIYYTVEEARESFGCGKDKILRLFTELEAHDLIERRRQGQGRPCMVYVKKVIADADSGKSEVCTADISTSRESENRSQEVVKPAANDTEKNNTELNELYPSVPDVTEEDIREQLEYDIMIQNEPTKKQQIDEVVSLITDTLLSHAKTIRIGNTEVDKSRVDGRLRQLEYEHIEYVFDRMVETKSEIRNIRAYLLTALYNAPVTMDSYYTALVNHDMQHWRPATL